MHWIQIQDLIHLTDPTDTSIVSSVKLENFSSGGFMNFIQLDKTTAVVQDKEKVQVFDLNTLSASAWIQIDFPDVRIFLNY